MSAVPTLLIVAADPQLVAEFESALAPLGEHRPLTSVVAGAREAIETARGRRPDVALIEMGADLGALSALCDELAAASPETMLVGAFRPELFGHDVSESAVLIAALRAGLRDFVRRPLSAVDMDQLLQRIGRRRATAPARMGTVVSFVSNKGGVGKSTLSLNTAVGLARRHPDRVLLIDASLQMGVCATMLDLAPQVSLTDAFREKHRLDEQLIRQLATPHPCGLHLLAAPATAVEAAEVDEEVVSRVITLARRAYDFVVVDTFPMFDAVVMAVLDLSDRSYVVLDNVVPTLLGAVKLVQLLDGLSIPRDRQRVVLNRYRRGSGNIHPLDVARRLGRDVDHIIPYHDGVVLAANLGQPYILRAGGWSSCGRSFRWLVDEIDALGRTVGPAPSANGAAHASNKVSQ